VALTTFCRSRGTDPALPRVHELAAHLVPTLPARAWNRVESVAAAARPATQRAAKHAADDGLAIVLSLLALGVAAHLARASTRVDYDGPDARPS